MKNHPTKKVHGLVPLTMVNSYMGDPGKYSPKFPPQSKGGNALDFYSKYFGSITTKELTSRHKSEDILAFFKLLEEADSISIKVNDIEHPYVDPTSEIEVEAGGIKKTISAQLFLALMPQNIKAEVNKYGNHYQRITTILEKTKKDLWIASLYDEEEKDIGDDLSFLHSGKLKDVAEEFFKQLKNNRSVILNRVHDNRGDEKYYISLAKSTYREKIPLWVVLRAGGAKYDQNDAGQNFLNFKKICEDNSIRYSFNLSH